MTAAFSAPQGFRHRRGFLAFHQGMPLLMGILNATPDSFSDGGEFLKTVDALRHAEEMIRQGADILDVGGESTRPGFHGVSAQEEIARVVPVIRGIRQFSEIPISVDTSKAEVARAALEAGADIVNDVRACQDPGFPEVLREFQPGVVLMDDRSLPPDAVIPDDIREYLRLRRDALMETTGLPEDAFLLDPGVGFGKSDPQNLQCIRFAAKFSLGKSGVLLGVSRKSYIGRLTGETDPKRRLPGTLASAILARGVQVLRVHDVAEHRQALLMAQLLDRA